MAIDEDLRKETERWLAKIEEERKKIGSGDDYIIKNIDAYISDSRHFMEKGDLIRAFEAVVWSWAYIEIGRQKKLI
ncbi:MAG: DUF357 domain-containing protein [Candidatus Aenigmarchaeota archaeon]|nr:DUF357 domain-containing protein [Candidatus Aenigmarchaeota archaeon]